MFTQYTHTWTSSLQCNGLPQIPDEENSEWVPGQLHAVTKKKATVLQGERLTIAALREAPAAFLRTVQTIHVFCLRWRPCLLVVFR